MVSGVVELLGSCDVEYCVRISASGTQKRPHGRHGWACALQRKGLWEEVGNVIKRHRCRRHSVSKERMCTDLLRVKQVPCDLHPSC